MNTHDLKKYVGFPMCYTVKEKEVTLSNHSPIQVGDHLFNPPLASFPKDFVFVVETVKETRPARRRIKLLRDYKMYLEKNPSPEFIEKEITRWTDTAERIMASKVDFVPIKKNGESEFRSISGITVIKRQIKTLKEIRSLWQTENNNRWLKQTK